VGAPAPSKRSLPAPASARSIAIAIRSPQRVRAALKTKAVTAALKRCATQNQVQHRVFERPASSRILDLKLHPHPLHPHPEVRACAIRAKNVVTINEAVFPLFF
jgi:hypothetical protein